MRDRGPFSALRFISITLILLAIVLTTLQLVRFSRVRAYLPSGLRIAGVPVGGLDRSQAAQRLLEMYQTPVELRYNGAPIQMSPSMVDFQLDVESMLAAADQERTQELFWQEFWDYLWGRSSFPQEVPLRFTYSEARLRAYLAEVGTLYDQPPQPALPIPGTVNFQPGQEGTSIDLDSSVRLIERALRSLNNREVDLPLQRTDPTRPAFRNLEILLKQTVQNAGIDGLLVGIYLQDLRTAQELHFAVQDGEDVPVKTDIAFTASSTIKLPIMMSVYRRISDEEPDPETENLLSSMIELSGNETADWLMDRVIDDTKGPLLVTEDMQSLGLQNTFLAGYFTAGSPLLQAIETPANTRPDVFTDPDPYSQTTPSDMGMLLSDLYQCSQTGGSTLGAVFPGEITQAECQAMVSHLINNHVPFLLTAGIPDGTPIAHKHGYVTSPEGVINTIGDAGIIYSPGGAYVLVVFAHHPDQIIWDPANELFRDLSAAVYNYFNISGSGS